MKPIMPPWVSFCLLVCLWLSIFLSAAAAEVVERIVAIVNDEIITQSELDQMAKALQSQPGITLPKGSEKDLQRQLLDAIIVQKLAKAEAKRRGLAMTDKEVNMAVEQFKKRNRIEDDQLFVQLLAKNGLTLKDFKQQLADQMTNERLMNMVVGGKTLVTETDVRTFYDREFPKTGGVQFHLRLLNLPFPPGGAEAQKEEVRKKAELILQEQRKGVSWDELRQKHALLFQDLGFIAQTDLDPKLAQLLANAKPGETVPVQTLQGFQLFQVVARRDGKGLSFEEAAPEIRQMLQRREMEKHFNEWIKGQKDRSHIKIMM